MSKKLLVVVDMQNDFIDGALGTPEAQTIVDDVVKYVEDYNLYEDKIIFTMDTHFPDYLNTQEGEKLPREHCIYQTYGWNLHNKFNKFLDEFGDFDNLKVIEKSTFGSVELGNIVKYSDIDEVEICGLCTDICVISNALLIKAFVPEVKIKVHRNLCAGVTPESHETALKTMSACQIEIVD